MINDALDTPPTPVRRAFREVLAQHGMVHSLKKTPCNGVSIYEMVSSDADGEWFEFSTIYVRDTGEHWETHFSLSGDELIRFAEIAKDFKALNEPADDLEDM